MEYTARWGQKGWLISPQKVVALEQLKVSFALKATTNEDTSGTPPTNTKGRELQEITLEATYLRGAGTLPREQITEWESLIGDINPLYIGGKQFGADNFQLTKVDVSDIQITPKGEFIAVTIAITLKEWSPQEDSLYTETTSDVDGATAALGATPTAADKERLMSWAVGGGGKLERKELRTE